MTKMALYRRKYFQRPMLFRITATFADQSVRNDIVCEHLSSKLAIAYASERFSAISDPPVSVTAMRIDIETVAAITAGGGLEWRLRGLAATDEQADGVAPPERSDDPSG